MKSSGVTLSHKQSVLNFAYKVKKIDLILHMNVNVFVDFVSAANFTFNIDKSLYFSPLINQTMPRSYPTLNIKLLFTWLLSPIFVDVEVPAKEAVKTDDEERGTNK